MSPAARPLMRCLLLLAVAAAFLAGPGQIKAQRQPAPAPEVDLELRQASPEEAFNRLGQRFGCQFAVVDEEQWVGPEQAVTVTADLSRDAFWQAVMRLSEITGYEPVFRPYGQSEGLPVIWLSRVDVAAERSPRAAVASGPVLIRTSRAYFSIPLETARLRLVPTQVAVETEVFVEPGEPAVFVTAVALRAIDGRRSELRRAEGLDPTAGIDGGIAQLVLHFDAPQRVPAEVSNWRGQIRLVREEQRQILSAPLQLVEPEEAPLSPATQPAGQEAAPATPEHTRHALGPYHVLLQPAVLEASAARQERPEARRLTVRMTLPRAEMDHTAWSRLYGFLLALPPEIAAAGGEGSPWRLEGYAIYSAPSADDPTLASSYLVWARYEAPPDAPDPQRLEWSLPVESSEERANVLWRTPVPIEAPAEPAPDEAAPRR